ncbi:MAG: hypothetical protein LBD01_05070 [Puniceicoccales bacterium]|jgi:hypothetical protein|nr:hypothetical protein [Puniceicoccales bacterium]
MSATENYSTDPTDTEEEASDANFAEWAPSPWEEVKKMQYGGDRTFAHVVENWVLTSKLSERPGLEKKLLVTLASPKASLAAKDFLCRMLALIGSEFCAKALAPLLLEKETSHLARMALEGIPGKEVDDMLANALPKLDGNEKKGLLGTLAVRASCKRKTASQKGGTK